RRSRGDVIADGARWSVIAAAIAGAAVGSKILYWFEDPAATWQHVRDPIFLLQGKTIVGGLVGGLIAVEATKRVVGVREATGALLAVPLAIGIAIGRIGCFLTGLADGTAGTPTRVPWAVDFGDGVPRHPAQIYETLFMAAFAIVLSRVARRPHANGDVFKLFMAGYMGFRLGVDELKPAPAFFGLSALQWVAAAVLLYYARIVWRRWRAEPAGVDLVSTA